MLTSDADDTTPFVANVDGPRSDISNKHRSKHYATLPFIYFITAAVLTICAAILSTIYSDIACIVSGIIGLAISLFGIKHFRTIIPLTTTVNSYTKLNHKFRNERNQIKESVNRLSKARSTLNETHNRLVHVNAKNRENLTHFRGVQDSMEKCNIKSFEQLQNALSRSRVVEANWHKELYQHERNILHTVFDRFYSNHTHIGMNEKEFEQFTLQLPITYRERFERLGTFNRLSGNKGYILLEDFEKTLDIFAEMNANDCEIDFHIIPTPRKRKKNPKKTFKIRRRSYSLIRKTKSISCSSLTITVDEDPEIDDVDDDRKYDTDLLKYQRQVIITRRSHPGERLPPPDMKDELGFIVSTSSFKQISCLSNLSPTSRGSLTPVSPSLYRTATLFEDENITDLTAVSELEEMPDIEFVKTEDIQESEIDKFMGKTKQRKT